jgi:hypothetical protein
MSSEPSEPELDEKKKAKLLDSFGTPHVAWREVSAGLIAVAISTADIWTYGHDRGFSSSLDEILILTGIALIAGVKNLFGGRATTTDQSEKK